MARGGAMGRIGPETTPECDCTGAAAGCTGGRMGAGAAGLPGGAAAACLGAAGFGACTAPDAATLADFAGAAADLGVGSGLAPGGFVVFGLIAVVNFSTVADLGGDLGFVMTAGVAGGALCSVVLAVLSPLVLPPMSEPHSSLEKSFAAARNSSRRAA